MADAFHQATVAHKDECVVVNDCMAGPVKFAGEQFFRQCHANRIGKALAERAGSGFHARGIAQFGMAGGFAVQLAEVFKFLHRQVVACQMQHRIQQHGSMAVAKHKAVTPRPAGVRRVVAQIATAPQSSRHVGHAHWSAGVAGIGLLHSVHRQGANRIRHQAETL